MHILLIAATTFEIQPVIDHLNLQDYSFGGHTVEVLVSGVGIMHTTYQLTNRLLQNRPDLLMQAGIGGSFSPTLSPGEVVLVEREIVGDLGVEEGGTFKDIVDMGFLGANEGPYADKWLVNPQAGQWAYLSLPVVRGCTINKISTRPESIGQLQQKYGVSVESMEGAAFHYVALQANIPFLQLRAISNYVGERDKANWKIKDSIAAVNVRLLNILNSL